MDVDSASNRINGLGLMTKSDLSGDNCIFALWPNIIKYNSSARPLKDYFHAFQSLKAEY